MTLLQVGPHELTLNTSFLTKLDCCPQTPSQILLWWSVRNTKCGVQAMADTCVAVPVKIFFTSSSEFEAHLKGKAKEIKKSLDEIFANISSSTGPPPANVAELQASLSKLLATQKEQLVEIERLRSEKDQLKERLESASLRCIKAEKKLDRVRSSAVAKLEQQAIAGTGNSAGSGIGNVETGPGSKSEGINGSKEETPSEESEIAYKQATATVVKQKTQLDDLLAENKNLTAQLTAASVKLSNLSDDDYARTELFKYFKTQHDDVIKRVNHLEATNIQLRQEAERLHAERTAFRTEVDSEAQVTREELEGQLTRVETDLARIRSARDELLADQAIRKAGQENEHQAAEHAKELAGAREDRLEALELEVERLRTQVGHGTYEPTPTPELEGLDIDTLRQRYAILEHSFASVNKELPAMEKAYKRSMALASNKVTNFAALEEKVSVLLAEKTKADQKYFAARKDMDIRFAETRTLRAQNVKSADIITQLKEVESTNRSMLTNLEKQLSELRQANTLTITSSKKLEAASSEAISKAESLKNQVTELTQSLKAKDTTFGTTQQKLLATQTELEQLRVRHDHVQKDRESWKAKSMSNSSDQEDMLRVSTAKHT